MLKYTRIKKYIFIMLVMNMYGNLFDYPELRKRQRNEWNEAGVRSS